MRNLRIKVISLVLVSTFAFVTAKAKPVTTQNIDQLTPIQREIERQRQRLNSADEEERRDALMHLANMRRPDSSRVAAGAVNDTSVKVRVAAVHAVVFLPPAEGAAILLPLLQDRDEFVRREVAFALGETHSRNAVGSLTALLASDKEASVRAAAAMALGEIRDETAITALAQVLSSDIADKKKKRSKNDQFVMRAAARSLGQIRSRAALPALIAVLSNDQSDVEIRREAATALGLIGDPSATPSLRAALESSDPYLSEAARQALRRLAPVKN